MIFVFIVDTSASMNRLFSENLSFLDAAKSGVEQFFKWEHMSSNRANNKYMLVTYQDECYTTLPETDSDQVLLHQVKLLNATDVSSAGTTFAKTFDYLDAHRRKSNFDTIGRGRYPAESETTTIFWFTDGSHFTEKTEDSWALSDQLNIPRLQTPGQEFYREPFRWDQRLFTLWMTHFAPPQSKVTMMSDAMHGEWWQIPNVRYLMQCIDNCMHTKHAQVFPYAPICSADGVVAKMVESPLTAGPQPVPGVALMIYSNKSSTRHFPIPEGYWVNTLSLDPGSTSNIPARDAHPVILYTKRDDIYPIPEGFPVDRFSVDQRSHIVQELMKQKEKISWTLYMQNSSSAPGHGEPFGTLKYSESSKTVSMYLMPYNFPRLFSAIIDLRKRHLAAAAGREITDYVRAAPIYYREPLRKAFVSVSNVTGLDVMKLWPSDISTEPHPHTEFWNSETVQQSRVRLQDIKKQVLDLRIQAGAEPLVKRTLYSNPFDIPRDRLLTAVADLKAALGSAAAQSSPVLLSRRITPRDPEEDAKHTVPISQMGNYGPRMNKQQRLRDPLEDEDEARQRDRNVFGNPYRVGSKDRPTNNDSIDEEDEAVRMDNQAPSITTSSSSNRRKRKRYPPTPTSSTGSTAPFNKTRIPTLSRNQVPLLFPPPRMSWKDLTMFPRSTRLVSLVQHREALKSAYRPTVEMASLREEGAFEPPKQNGVAGSSHPLAPPPLPQDNRPRSPQTSMHELRKRVRGMVWCERERFDPDGLPSFLAALDTQTRVSLLPFAVRMAKDCRRHDLVNRLQKSMV
ncbi:Integrator complex subunit 6 [Thoreauomyces humboldtii]|nr:Integrator complex subunit 6 [Thoreauomyces humboldtii]